MATSKEWLIDGRYRIGGLIGTGSFGTFWTILATFSHYPSGSTYAGYDIFSGEKVALKLEPRSSSHFHLENECTIYHYLGPNCAGIPQLRWSGTERGYSVIVLSLLGPSLESIFSSNKHHFTPQVVATIAEQSVRQSFQFVPIYWLSSHRFPGLSKYTHVTLFTETWSLKMSWLDPIRTSIPPTSLILALRSDSGIHRPISISHTEMAIPWLERLDLRPSMPIWALSYLVGMTSNRLPISSYILCMVHFLGRGRAGRAIGGSSLFRRRSRTCR